jgi:hypothetical protein
MSEDNKSRLRETVQFCSEATSQPSYPLVMFDRLGRILCRECSGSMRIIDATPGEALFKCDQCNNCSLIKWDPPGGKERKRRERPQAA